MDSIFAKTIVFFASILAVLNPPDYIKIASDNLILDFKTGESYPIQRLLNIQNIGPKTQRFEISSDSDWVSGYREGTEYNFVELGPQAYVNFVLTVRPERLRDGANESKVAVKVLDIDSLVSEEQILDEAEVLITLNKNIVSTEIPEPVLSPTESPSSTPVLSPVPTVIMTPGPPQAPKAAADLNPVLKQIQSLINSISELLGRFFGVY